MYNIAMSASLQQSHNGRLVKQLSRSSDRTVGFYFSSIQ